MNTVIFLPYSLWKWHLATALEIAQQRLDAGDQVAVLACNGELQSCDMNPQHRWKKCSKCRSQLNTGLKLLDGEVHVESFYRLSAEDWAELDDVQTRFATIAHLKAFKIEGFDIGMAALSSLVSLERDPEVDLEEHADMLSKMIRSAWIAHRSFENYLKSNDVDRVYMFNGRFAPVRGVMRVCQQNGIECITHERGHDRDHYALYPSTLPHDQRLFQENVRKAWREASKDSDREEIARRWFHQRAGGVAQSWFSFVAEQRADELPDDWDEKKRNVVFVSSSEDEFVSISDRWSNPLYPTQLDALRAILDSMRSDADDLHLYLRLHPNLAGVDNRQTRELTHLTAPFLTVIQPTDATSTYAMIRGANKVVSVGSTAGLEAVYWGTPSILVGPAFYQDLGATYNPASHDELIQLIRANLEPKDIEPALMFGHYSATFGEPFEHFKADGFLDGTFKGAELSPALADRVRIWLLDRPSSIQRRLVRLICKKQERSGRPFAQDRGDDSKAA